MDEEIISAETPELESNALDGNEGFTDAQFLQSLKDLANGVKEVKSEDNISDADLVIGHGEDFDTDLDETKVTKPQATQKVAEVKAESKIEEKSTEEKPGSESGPTQGRDRAYLGHLDPLKAETMKLAAAYPALSFADAEVMARKALGIAESEADDGTVAYEDLPASAKLEVDQADLKDIEDLLIEKDRIGLRDEEWEDLSRKRNDLHASIAINRHDAAQEQAKSNDWNKSFESAEAQIIQEFPDVANVESDLYYLVDAKTRQLVELSKQGRAPDWYNPTDPAALRRIVVEAKSRLEGTPQKSALEAKPNANGAEQRSQTTEKIGGVPSSASLSQVTNRSAAGIIQEERVQLDPDSSDADFLASLSGIIRGNKTTGGAPARNEGVRPSRFHLV